MGLQCDLLEVKKRNNFQIGPLSFLSCRPDSFLDFLKTLTWEITFQQDVNFQNWI